MVLPNLLLAAAVLHSSAWNSDRVKTEADALKYAAALYLIFRGETVPTARVVIRVMPFGKNYWTSFLEDAPGSEDNGLDVTGLVFRRSDGWIIARAVSGLGSVPDLIRRYERLEKLRPWILHSARSLCVVQLAGFTRQYSEVPVGWKARDDNFGIESIVVRAPDRDQIAFPIGLFAGISNPSTASFRVSRKKVTVFLTGNGYKALLMYDGRRKFEASTFERNRARSRISLTGFRGWRNPPRDADGPWIPESGLIPRRALYLPQPGAPSVSVLERGQLTTSRARIGG